jgi:hypothetical protein
MKARCLNPNHVHFRRYGGAGIKIDSSWITSFKKFLSDVWPCPPDCNSLDRVDPSGNYTKENVRWATAKQQANNRKKSVRITVNGQSMTLAEACEKFEIKYTTARERLKHGLSGAAVFAPVATRTPSGASR